MVVPVGHADTLDHQMLPRLQPLFWRLTRNQRGVGVTLVEYGLLIALLSVVWPAIQAVLTTAASAMN